MKQQKLKPIKLLLKWSGKNRVYLILSVICAFIGGVFTIGLYIGIYRIIDALLLKNLTKEIITQSAVLITSTVIIRHVFLAASGILSHKGAYGALFKVRCMVTEHLAKVTLGSLGERRTGDIKTVLKNIEKWSCVWRIISPNFSAMPQDQL